MKASELIRQLQEGIDQGRDWEVVHDAVGLPMNVVEWCMPSLQERQDDDAQPYIVITQRA